MPLIHYCRICEFEGTALEDVRGHECRVDDSKPPFAFTGSMYATRFVPQVEAQGNRNRYITFCPKCSKCHDKEEPCLT